MRWTWLSSTSCSRKTSRGSTKSKRNLIYNEVKLRPTVRCWLNKKRALRQESTLRITVLHIQVMVAVYSPTSTWTHSWSRKTCVVTSREKPWQVMLVNLAPKSQFRQLSVRKSSHLSAKSLKITLRSICTPDMLKSPLTLYQKIWRKWSNRHPSTRRRDFRGHWTLEWSRQSRRRRSLRAAKKLLASRETWVSLRLRPSYSWKVNALSICAMKWLRH